MTKFNTLIKFKDNTVMYQRDSNEAFTNAKAKGLDKPTEVMSICILKIIKTSLNILWIENILALINNNNQRKKQ